MMRKALGLTAIFVSVLALAHAMTVQSKPPSTEAILTPIIASYRQPGRIMCIAAKLDHPDQGIVGLPSVGEPGVSLTPGLPNWMLAGKPVETGLSRQLDQALQIAVKNFARKRLGITITHVPAPFILVKSKSAGADCDLDTVPRLNISEPLIAGDFAFVKTDYNCGTMCGEGFLQALQLVDRKWQIVGERETWIS